MFKKNKIIMFVFFADISRHSLLGELASRSIKKNVEDINNICLWNVNKTFYERVNEEAYRDIIIDSNMIEELNMQKSRNFSRQKVTQMSKSCPGLISKDAMKTCVF